MAIFIFIVYTAQMNLEKRFIEIKQFLNLHWKLVEREVLDQFPFDKNPYLEWVDELQSLPKIKVLELENSRTPKDISSKSYTSFLEKVNELCSLEKTKNYKTNIPNLLKKKVSKKKQHEITQIKSLLERSQAENLIDIGSGAGHLSSVLLYENDKKSLCVDQQQEFQQIGKKKLERDAPDIYKRINFKNAKITKNFTIPQLPNALLIGLHTCGNLSVDLILAFANKPTEEFLNYGCCYHKLDDDYFNISQLSKENKLCLSNHALTMAAKSYKDLSLDDFNFRNKVKSYRYSIHLLMESKLNLGFKTLGNAKAEDYNGSFLEYVRNFLPEAKNIQDEEINVFFKKVQSSVEQIILMGVIRSHLSRLVELYIILDRAIFLRENHFNVKVLETFDKNISPRNIAIYISGKKN